MVYIYLQQTIWDKKVVLACFKIFFCKKNNTKINFKNISFSFFSQKKKKEIRSVASFSIFFLQNF